MRPSLHEPGTPRVSFSPCEQGDYVASDAFVRGCCPCDSMRLPIRKKLCPSFQTVARVALLRGTDECVRPYTSWYALGFRSSREVGRYVASDAFRPRLRACDSNEPADIEKKVS